MIRPATLADLDALLHLEQICFDSDRLSRRQFRYLLTKAHARLLVYESKGEVMAYVLLLLSRGTSMARIYSISVAPEARGHRVIPSVRTIQDLSRKSIYTLDTEELERLARKTAGRAQPDVIVNGIELMIYFGECAAPAWQELARQLFDVFPCPAPCCGWSCAVRANGASAPSRRRPADALARTANRLRDGGRRLCESTLEKTAFAHPLSL